MPTVLVVTPDSRLLQRLNRAFAAAAVTSVSATTLLAALPRLAGAPHDAVLIDVSLLGRAPRVTVNQLRAAAPGAPILVISSAAEIEHFVECVRDNLVTVLPRPLRRFDRFVNRLAGTAPESNSDSELAESTVATPARGIIHASKVMKTALSRALIAAGTANPVLLLGETGTGKDLMARFIHESSARRSAPFVPVNCASLSDEIADAELYGRTKGAFTGATDRRGGLFHHAAGGTLFLDEIGELGPKVQAKLLRVLEDGEVRMVGDVRAHHVSVRVIAASNRDLEAEAGARRFRLDLYHRIACHRVGLPPLRARRGDIPLLARHFLAELEPEGIALTLTTCAIDALVVHNWPGNVRELRQVVRGAAATARGLSITASDLGPLAQRGRHSPASNVDLQPSRLSLRSVEHEALQRALKASDGNVTVAARLLGVGRSTFYRKLARRADVEQELAS